MVKKFKPRRFDGGIRCVNCGCKEWRFLKWLINNRKISVATFYCTHCHMIMGKFNDTSMYQWKKEIIKNYKSKLKEVKQNGKHRGARKLSKRKDD